MFNQWDKPEGAGRSKPQLPDFENFDATTWKHASGANGHGWPVFSLAQFEALLKEKNAHPDFVSAVPKASIEEIPDEGKVEKPKASSKKPSKPYRKDA